MGGYLSTTEQGRGGIWDESGAPTVLSAVRNEGGFSESNQWGEVIGMIQATLRDVNLEEECNCHTTILIPKGGGEF